ncbi:hypothetical protein ZWY2020_033023 [Hordeum vulgare]|nr:hypothetical protein ZWY2020_033023 [Hordeum vulgare]
MMTAVVYYHDVSLSTYLSRNAKLSSIITTMASSQQFLLSLDWELVRRKASFVVYQLLLESPELRRLLILPRETLNPQQLLPIGPLRPRRHVRKQARRPIATAMARLYLDTKRSLFSSKSPHLDTNPSLYNIKGVRSYRLMVDQMKNRNLKQYHQVGVFGAENCTDGASASPLLMVEGAGCSGCQAISSLNSPPFLAIEACMERLGVHPCNKRSGITEYCALFPATDFSLIDDDEDALWEPDVREAIDAVATRGMKFIDWKVVRRCR